MILQDTIKYWLSVSILYFIIPISVTNNISLDRILKALKENQKKMKEFYSTLHEALEDDDVFPFRRTKYVLDISKFVFDDKLSGLDSKDYEPTFKNYTTYLSEELDQLKYTVSNMTEKYFESFKLHSSIENLTNYLKESDMLGSAGFTILPEAKDIHILDVVEDTTCEEFMDYLKAFSDNTKSFSKNIYNTIKALSKATVDAAGKADAYFKKSYAILEELKKPYEEKENIIDSTPKKGKDLGRWCHFSNTNILKMPEIINFYRHLQS